MTITVYNFIKEDCPTCENNTKLLNRIVGLDVIDVIPEECLPLVDKYNICTTPTAVFVSSEKGLIATEIGELTVEQLDKILYLDN